MTESDSAVYVNAAPIWTSMGESISEAFNSRTLHGTGNVKYTSDTTHIGLTC
jgi:hypothetical protein